MGREPEPSVGAGVEAGLESGVQPGVQSGVQSGAEAAVEAAMAFARRQAEAGARQEVRRLAALAGVAVLDTPPEPHFDALVVQAASRFATPFAAISLVDAERQWFKAAVGLPAGEISTRDHALCNRAIRQAEVLVVPDATADPRFADSPLVTGAPHIRFYAGAPLTLPEGERLGTLCVIDTVPRADFGAAERSALRALAQEATTALLARRAA